MWASVQERRGLEAAEQSPRLSRRLKLEGASQVRQATPSDLTSAIQNIHSASKGLPLSL